MADVSRRVSLIFDADTSAVENRLRELSNSLKDILNISTKTSGISSIDKNLQEAAKSAALLQTQLKNAVNVKTGNLDLSKFDESLKSSNMSIEKYKQAFSQIGPAGEQTFLQLARAISTADIPLKRSSELLNNFAITMRNTVKWQLSSSLMHGFMGSISSALTYAQNLNKNLTDIRIVSGQSADEMARFAEQANRSARELSTTTNRYTEAALIFYQQGLNDQQVKERTDTVIKMANVTGEAMTDVSSYMTAIWNNFADGTKNLEYYSDVIVKLGADTASSSEEIAGGLEKFIAIGDQIGLSYEYAAAALTTITAQTRQSEDVVGTALRTIFARIQGLNLGETLDDGTTLNKYSSALQKVGVDIKDASGQLKDMDVILDDLGSKWGTLGRDTQIALAQTVGGVRQYNQIIALMDNWDFFQENLQTAYSSEGSLDKQAEIYAESWEAAQKRVKASAEAIYSSLINDDFFIGLNNALSGILDQINVFIQSLGGVEGVLATLSTIFLTVFRDQITASLKDLTYNITQLTTSGKQRLINMQKSVQQLLISSTADKGSVGKGAAADAYATEAKAQLLLIDNAKKLSAQEKAVADILMRQLQLRVDAQVAAGEELDNSEKRLNNLNERIRNEFGGLNDNSKENNTILKYINDITLLNSALSSTGQTYENFGTILKDTSLDDNGKLGQIKENANAIRGLLASVNFNENSLGGKGIFDALDKLSSIENLSNAQEAIKSLGNIFVELAAKSEGMSKIVSGEFQKKSDKAQKDGNTEEATRLQQLSTLFSQSSVAASDFGEKLSDLKLSSEDLALIFETLNKHMGDSGKVTVSTQQKIVTLATTFSSFAMVITQVQGLIDMWKSDASFGQKMLSSLMVLGTVLPVIISLNKELALILPNSVLAAFGLTGTGTAAVGAGAGAEVASKGFKKLWQSILGPAALAVAAIGLVVGVIKLISDALQPEEKETKLEKANRELEELKSSTEAIRTSTDELRSAWENYTSVEERLASLKRGTEEWAEAMRDASEASAQLQNNNLIQAVISNPEAFGLSPEQIENADGSINYEIINDAIEAYSAYQTAYNSYLTARDQREVNNDVLDVPTTEESRIKLDDLALGRISLNAEEYKIDFSEVDPREAANAIGLQFLTYISNMGLGNQYTSEDFMHFIGEGPEGTYSKILESLKSGDGITQEQFNVLNGISFLGDFTEKDEEGLYHFKEDEEIPYSDIYEEYFWTDLLSGFNAPVYGFVPLYNALTDGNTTVEHLGLGTYELNSNNSSEELSAVDFMMRFGDLFTGADSNLLQPAFLYNSYSRSFSSKEAQDYSYMAPYLDWVGMDFSNEFADTVNYNTPVFTALMDKAISNFLYGIDKEEEAKNYYANATDAQLLQNLIDWGITYEDAEEQQTYLETLKGYSGSGELKLGETTVTEEQLQNLALGAYVGENRSELAGVVTTILTEELSDIPPEVLENLLSTGNIYSAEYKQSGDYLDAAKHLGYIDDYRYKQISDEIAELDKFATSTLGFDENTPVEGVTYDDISFLSNKAKAEEESLDRKYFEGFELIYKSLAEDQQAAFIAYLSERGFRQGYAGYKDVEDFLEEENIDIKTDTLESAETFFTDGYDALSQFTGITSKTMELAQQLVDGDELDDSELQQLEVLGFDTLKLRTHEGAKYLEDFYLNYIDAINEDIAKYSEEEGDLKDKVLPNVDLGVLLNSGLESILDVNSILINLFGNTSEEYAYYLELYINNLADSYGIELSDSFFEEPTTDWASSFKELTVGITIADGINGLINNYTELVLNGTAKELLSIKKSRGFLSSENIQTLEELKGYYADILGVESNSITDEMLEELVSIEGFNSIDRNEVIGALNAARRAIGLPSYSKVERYDIVDAIIRSNLANYEMPEDINSVMDAFVSGDYSNISQRQLGNTRKDFDDLIQEESGRNLFLQQLGYLNENGELTEAAYRVGFTTREEIISAFAEALNYEVNTDAILASANQFAKNALGRLFDNIEADTIDATEEQLSTLASLFDEIGSSSEAEVLANIIQDLLDGGQSLDKINQAFSEIDWENITVEELGFVLEELGYSADISDSSLWNLINSMQEAIGYTNELTNALNNYSSASSAISSLRDEGKVSTEQYDTIAELIGYDRAGEYFKLTPEGDYDLEEEISAEDVIRLIRQGLSEDLGQGVEYADNIRDTIETSGLADSTTSEDFIQRVSSDNLIGQYISENQGEIFGRVGINNEELQNEIIEAITKGDSTALDNLLGKGNTSISALGGAIFATTEQDVEEANEAKEGQERSDWEQDVEDLGLDVEEAEMVRNSILAQNEALEGQEELLNEITIQQMRHTRGYEEAQENIKDWVKSLKEGNKALEEGNAANSEYYETVVELGETYADLFDADVDDFSDAFIKSTENAELLQKALEDDQEALDELQSRAMSDMLIKAGVEIYTDDGQQLTGQSLADRLNAITSNAQIEDLEIGATLDDDTFNALLGDLQFNTAEAANAMNDALGTVGLEGEVVPYVVNENGVVQVIPEGQITYTTSGEGVLTSTFSTNASGTMQTYQEGSRVFWGFKNARKTSDPIKVGSSRRSGGGGGGGGGGGSRAPRAERKTDTDKDRYRTVKNQLEDLTDTYDKVSTAADRAFGETKLELLKQQERAIQDLIAKQREYIDEINEYYDIDRQAVEEVSSRLGFEVQFDENGTITNWDEIQNQMIEEYNSHINDKGEVIGMDEEAWEEYEKEWERVMELFEQYDETQDLRKEALQQLQDYANQLYDLQLQEVTYVVEIKIDATDDVLEILDYMLGRIEDDAWAAAEAIAYMGQKAAEIQLQNDTYTEGIRGILMNHTRDLVDSEGNIVNSASLTVEDVEGFMSGQEAAIKKIMALNEEFTDEEVQQLREYNSSLIEMNETLNDLRNEVFDKVLDSFEAFNDEMDRSIDKIDHLSSLTENYANIIDIVGQKNLEISNALMESISQAAVDQATNRVEATREKMLTIQEEIARAEEALADAKSKGLEEDVKLWEDTLKEMNDSLDEAEEEFLQSWEDALTAAAEAFEASMNRAISTFSDALAGPLLGSLEQLEEMFDRQNTIADRYLPDYEKIYELNKLNRDITNSIDDTDNIRAKQELAALQEEINKLEEDGVQVSEYQVENLRRRYELKLAELALTESQNAKSEVRMTRNADGDWSYVYVADEEQVAEAEQNYEDKLFAMQQANAEYINNLNDMIIQMETELTAKLEEIANDETLSQEEKMARMNETIAFYQEQMGYYMDELGLVLGENQILYEQDWTKYSELTGYKISANEAYVDHFNETALSLLTGYETMEEFQRAFNDAIGHPDSGGLLYDLDNAFKTWEANMEEVFESAGTTMEDFKDVVEDSVNDIVENSEEATESIEEMGDNVVSTFDEITSAVQNWSNVYSETIDSILSRNEMLAKSFNELLKAWAGFEEATEVEEGTAPGEDEEVDTGDLEGGDGQTEEDKGKIQDGDAVYIAEGTPGIADWAEGPGRRYYAFYRNNAGKRAVGSGVWYVTVDPKNKKWDGYIGRIHEKYLRKFDTGGYTGSWGAEGRVAMLHEKELVLNKQDTSNLLAAVGMIRDISKIIDLNAYASSYGNITSMPNVVDNTGILEQQVHITAEFPNATDKDEILSAFDDIINLASQYANRR